MHDDNPGVIVDGAESFTPPLASANGKPSICDWAVISACAHKWLLDYPKLIYDARVL
jgi:hypothetical protein